MKGDLSRDRQLDRKRPAAKGLVTIVLSVVLLVLLSMPMGILPPIGGLTNPGGGIWTVGEQASHPTHLELSYPALDGDVTILRDTNGIPHIFATTEYDLFFAQGFVHAQDRMFQLDAARRLARGQLAEVFGEDFVEADRFYRTIGLGALAEEFTAGPAADPMAEALESYADGVNALLDRAGTAGLALEFKLLDYRPAPWTPTDSVAVGLFLAWSLSGTFEDLELALLVDGLGPDAVKELFPLEGPFQRPVDPRWPSTRGGSGFGPALAQAARELLAWHGDVVATVGGGPYLGSNNWAVDGSRTDTGMPRLANDPHLQFTLPPIWYENHLVGGPFDVYGVSLPGVPTVLLGQNRNIAWGATNVGGDVIDLYRETLNGDRYLYQDVWRDLDVRQETIRVRGGDPVLLTVRSTIHGPLVTERGETLAMRWTGTESATAMRAFYEMNLATNWDTFKAALAYYTVPSQNFVYADTAGFVGMRSNGLYPIREYDARFPVDGASGAFEWTGFVPFDEYPETFDPNEDYVLSANQQPQANNYPHYTGWSWDPGYRARRIAEMLEADDSVTESDLAAMQLDTLDVMAREFSPFLDQAVAGSCASATCTAALAAMQAWDFRMDVDGVAPAIWWRLANHFREQVWADEWQAGGVSDLFLPLPNVLEDLLKNDPNSAWFDDVRTTGTETWDDIARRAWGFAVDDLTAELGSDVSAWRWGDIHSRTFDHFTGLEPLNRGPFPSGGDSLTVNVAAGDTAYAGPSWRLLADLSDPAKSKGIYPGGQSGNPLSPHYDDLLALWLEGRYHDILVPATVAEMSAARIESTLVLRGT